MLYQANYVGRVGRGQYHSKSLDMCPYRDVMHDAAAIKIESVSAQKT